MNQSIQTTAAPAPIGPYSQAIRNGHMLWVSGQIPLDPETGLMVQQDIVAETHQVMKNLGEVLKAGSSGFDRIMKVTIFLRDMNDFAKVNEVYGSYLQAPYPARETVEVSRLPKDANVEISAVAFAG